MKALLLAAGYGTRLKPITEHTPKCLVPVKNKPLLEYWLEMLLPHYCDHIFINTHYLAEQVSHFVDASSWRDAITLLHEVELLGTAGTIYKNRELLKNDAFILAHADNLTRFNLRDFIATHAARKPVVEITMMTFETDTPQSCGIVEVDSTNIVRGFHEKVLDDYGTQANAAVYIIEPSVIEFLASFRKECIDLSTEVLPHYLGRMQIYHNADYHRDIGTMQSLHLAEAEF